MTISAPAAVLDNPAPPVLEVAERAAIAGFVCAAQLFDAGEQRLHTAPPPANQRAWVRQADAGSVACIGRIGASADGATMIFCNRQHLYLIPMADVVQFEVLRIARTRGAGGAFLMVNCVRGDAQPVLLTIISERHPDGLRALARQLAESFARPLVIHPVHPVL